MWIIATVAIFAGLFILQLTENPYLRDSDGKIGLMPVLKPGIRGEDIAKYVRRMGLGSASIAGGLGYHLGRGTLF